MTAAGLAGSRWADHLLAAGAHTGAQWAAWLSGVAWAADHWRSAGNRCPSSRCGYCDRPQQRDSDSAVAPRR